MAQSKRAKVANYLCRLNFRSPLGSASNFNDLGFLGEAGKAHISKFYPGPVRPGFPELRGSSSRGTSSRKLSSGRSRAHTSPVKVQQRGLSATLSHNISR